MIMNNTEEYKTGHMLQLNKSNPKRVPTLLKIKYSKMSCEHTHFEVSSFNSKIKAYLSHL